MIDASGGTQAVVLGKFIWAGGIVHRITFAAALLHNRETRDVTRTIRNIDHVLERNAPVRVRYVRVHIDGGILVRPLVDLKKARVFVVLSITSPIWAISASAVISSSF